jgi:hypothetical protein
MTTKANELDWSKRTTPVKVYDLMALGEVFNVLGNLGLYCGCSGSMDGCWFQFIAPEGGDVVDVTIKEGEEMVVGAYTAHPIFRRNHSLLYAIIGLCHSQGCEYAEWGSPPEDKDVAPEFEYASA